MAGLLPSRRAATSRVLWPRGLRRAAFLLAASVALFWSSVATGRWSIPIPGTGPIYGDLLIAWVAVLVHISAWPNLWAGARAERIQPRRRVESVPAHPRRGRCRVCRPPIRVPCDCLAGRLDFHPVRDRLPVHRM